MENQTEVKNMNIMTISKLAPIKSNNILELQEWCGFYDRYTKYPADILERFAIGVYQIYQGMDWRDQLNKDESYCAAFIHFLICCEKIKINVDQGLMHQWDHSNFQDILYHLSGAQQQIFYCYQAGRTQRSSRFSREKLESNMNYLLGRIISHVSVERRAEGFELATSIMLGVL